MDSFDRHRYALVYRALAEVFERDRPADREENHLSYVLGSLASRIFVGTRYLPPDDLLEEAAQIIRTGNHDQLKAMAQRLREHALHLDELTD